MEKSLTSLKPNKSGLVKAKESVRTAIKEDLSLILNFDDNSIPFRERIFMVEKRLAELPQIEIPIEHHFAAGIYARTMIAPRGTMLTGKIYKVPQMIIVSKGDITIRSESYNGRLIGPHIYESPIGSKRFGYCHTDVVWTCLVKTNADNVEDAEKEIYAESFEEIDVNIPDVEAVCPV